MDVNPRLSMNQATIKYAPFAEAVRASTDAGIQSMGVWREPVCEVGLRQAAKIFNDSGLRFSSYCRGGFFTDCQGPSRRSAIDDNRRAIEETATLAAVGAPGSRPVLSLVAGGIPEASRDIVGARQRVRDAIEELYLFAQSAGVILAIEPLHPMFASDRCVINTIGQALDLAEDFDPSVVGLMIDTFHVWWDPLLFSSISNTGGQGRIACYQVSDWKTPLFSDVLLSRHYPGQGVIDLGGITEAVLQTGYSGDIEVEIFNADIWADTPDHVVNNVIRAFNSTLLIPGGLLKGER